MKHWLEPKTDDNSVSLLKKKNGLSHILAGILVQRGMKDPIRVAQFLKPELKHLEDPFAIKHMDLSISRILAAREKKEKVLLVGDYDVDGITSSVMTKQALESIDIVVKSVIPKRLTDGYGLTRKVLERSL